MIPAIAVNASVSSASDLSLKPTSPVRPMVIAPAQVSFHEIFDQMTRDAISTVRSGEAAAIAGIKGNASAQQVVDAVLASERALETLVAVRDKVVNAYQEISKMAI